MSVNFAGVMSDTFEVAMDGSVAWSRAGWGENSSFSLVCLRTHRFSLCCIGFYDARPTLGVSGCETAATWLVAALEENDLLF